MRQGVQLPCMSSPTSAAHKLSQVQQTTGSILAAHGKHALNVEIHEKLCPRHARERQRPSTCSGRHEMFSNGNYFLHCCVHPACCLCQSARTKIEDSRDLYYATPESLRHFMLLRTSFTAPYPSPAIVFSTARLDVVVALTTPTRARLPSPLQLCTTATYSPGVFFHHPQLLLAFPSLSTSLPDYA